MIIIKGISFIYFTHIVVIKVVFVSEKELYESLKGLVEETISEGDNLQDIIDILDVEGRDDSYGN